MRRSWLALILPLSYALVVACVGDDPDGGGTGPGDGTDGGSVNGEDGSGTSSSGGTNPDPDGSGGNDGAADAGADAEPKCGYPGEDCCGAGQLPCLAGSACGTAVPQKCMVTELAAVGEYTFFQSSPAVLELRTASAFFDSSGWKIGPDVIVSNNLTSWSPDDITANGPASYHVVLNRSVDAIMKAYSGGTWANCGGALSCKAPNGTPSDFWSIARIDQDLWIGSTNKIWRCTGSGCANTVTGLEATTWGEGKIVGTSAQDVWYSASTRAFHFNGTQWTIHEGLQANTIFQVRKDEVWVGGTTLQRWNGTTWSNPMTISGSAAPGTIRSMSGSGSNDIWAVGDSAGGVFTAHWDGTAWTLKTAPAELTGQSNPVVYAPSPIEAFMVAGAGIYRWDGTAGTPAWSKMTVPAYTVAEGTQPTWTAITGPQKRRP